MDQLLKSSPEFTEAIDSSKALFLKYFFVHVLPQPHGLLTLESQFLFR